MIATSATPVRTASISESVPQGGIPEVVVAPVGDAAVGAGYPSAQLQPIHPVDPPLLRSQIERLVAGENLLNPATPPRIDRFVVAAVSTGFDVNWTTDTPCRGVIDYGPTTAYGSSVDEERPGAAEVTGLPAGTLYHVRVRVTGTDPQRAVEIASEDRTVTTSP